MMRVPFRIGTTSYILPDDILPNVRFLAGKVDDVELVLFEVDEGENNLPDELTMMAIRQVALQHGLTFTVHLPLDLRLSEEDEIQERSISKALHAIQRTGILQPVAYILHLDGRNVRMSYRSAAWVKWNHRTRQALSRLVSLVKNPYLLAVENLDGYTPEFWDDVLDGLPLSRCVDVGHLWYDGHDPLPFLKKNISTTRVLHLHGISERDHQSLNNVAPAELKRVLQFLIDMDYSGVLTMEVFGKKDFYSSREALLYILHQMNLEARWENP